MTAFAMAVLSFVWEILKIVLAVKAAWFAYVLYGMHKGFIFWSH